MTLQEILKAMGLSEEQITKIMSSMKENKIFTASEENLDVRYSKLKSDHEGANKQLTEARELIRNLKKDTANDKGLQDKITEYETKITTLSAENEKLKVECALKVALLDAGAKASDIDYLIFKAGTGDRNLQIGDDGKLKGQDDLIAGLKTQFPGNFETPAQKQVQEHKLETGDPAADTNEPKTLGEALKMKYENNE